MAANNNLPKGWGKANSILPGAWGKSAVPKEKEEAKKLPEESAPIDEQIPGVDTTTAENSEKPVQNESFSEVSEVSKEENISEIKTVAAKTEEQETETVENVSDLQQTKPVEEKLDKPDYCENDKEAERKNRVEVKVDVKNEEGVFKDSDKKDITEEKKTEKEKSTAKKNYNTENPKHRILMVILVVLFILSLLVMFFGLFVQFNDEIMGLFGNEQSKASENVTMIVSKDLL